MYYYQHNIGDYRKDTSHLSMLEHGAYRQLLDTYYMTEQPLTLDHANLMRTHCARNADEMQAIENVLKDFFEKTGEGYIHKRCDLEIEGFHSKSDKARKSANDRWTRIKEQRHANALRTHSEGNANHKPLTINQEPLKDIALSAQPKKNTRLADDFFPDETARSLAFKLGVNVADELAKFSDHHKAKGSTMKDWQAAFRTWIRKSLEFSKQNKSFAKERDESRASACSIYLPTTTGNGVFDDNTIDVTPAAALGR